MQYILFVMLFTSPAASKAHPVWTLQSTHEMHFSKMEGCVKYGKHLQEMIDSTNTVAMRGWCIDQGSGNSTFSADNPFAKQATDAGKKEEDTPNFVQINSARTIGSPKR